MKRLVSLRVLMFWYVCLLIAWPVVAGADDASPVPAATGTLLITEVQTGSPASAAEEFVELHNPTNQPIDLSQYVVEFASASATDWQTVHRSVELSGVVPSGGYVLAASSYKADGQEVKYLANTATAWFQAGVSAAGGHARLVYESYQPLDNASCELERLVIDQVEWGASSLDGRVAFAANIPPDNSMQRHAAGLGGYADTNSDAADFALAAPTPQAATEGVLVPSTMVPLAFPQSGCTPLPEGPPASPDEVPPAPAPVTPGTPPIQTGLIAPQISEILPNPAAPATDAADEYIELYNPNEVPFNLHGFTLRTGLSGAYTYIFPENTLLPAQGFASFLAKDTKLVLSNSGGKVGLLDPSGAVIAESEAYTKAAAGQAWIFADNVWQWTSEPTLGTANVPAAPVSTAKQPAAQKAAGSASKKAATAQKASGGSVKTAKTTTAKPVKEAAEKPEAAALSTTTAPPSASLHTGILVGAAILAILYGAYEYRNDVANKIRQFRTNRATRAALRGSPKGR